MASSSLSTNILTALQNKAAQLRIESVRTTTEAASGHPSSCCSVADIVATLFFSVMRYDPTNPKALNSHRFILSKGRAAPLHDAAWAEAGLFPKSDFLKLHTLRSDLEGHPTPRLSFVESARAIQGRLLTVEDYYAHGGLGDAVLSVVGPEGMKVHKLAARTIPHSGKPDELVNHFGIGARSIVQAAKQITK